MAVSRRSFVVGASATILTLASCRKQATLQTQGTKPPNPVDVQHAADIIKRLPSHDYVAIMQALADLDKTEKWSTTGEPFNRRWKEYANPLLVTIWRDMGYSFDNDCESFCGVTLGWSLRRDGRKVPKDPAASQSFLAYGLAVATPSAGDIAVFTHRNDPSHGHVGIFQRAIDATHIQVLGANQLLSGTTNCGSGYSTNVVDSRSMPTDHELYLHKYVRP